MATQIQQVLTADEMQLTIFCGGMSYVGARLAGTWVGTVQFEASNDGVNFFSVSVTPFASGTDVSSATANGNWFTTVKSYVAFRVRISSYTSGSVIAYLATSTDAGYQNAFLASTSLSVNSSATSGTNTLTQAAQTNRAWRLKHLTVALAGPLGGASFRVQVFDGAITDSVLHQTYLEGNVASVGKEFEVTLPPDGITGTPGNAMTIRLLGAGNASSEINAQFSAA